MCPETSTFYVQIDFFHFFNSERQKRKFAKTFVVSLERKKKVLKTISSEKLKIVFAQQNVITLHYCNTFKLEKKEFNFTRHSGRR